jgi:serine/threonine protein kinase
VTHPASPNTPPSKKGNTSTSSGLNLPAREQLDAHEVGMIKKGGPTKADLRLIDIGQGPLVVKDFAGKTAWVRWIGRVQISRECRAYDWLGPLPGLARLVGRVDRHALALEFIDGEELARSPRRLEKGAQYLERLREIVEAMHERGLAHLDLRGRENVMLDVNDEIHVLDLAAAVWFRPGSLGHRLFFGWFKLADQAALLKFKRILGAGEYTEKEQAFLRRFRFYRSLWIFNRKPSLPKDRG